MTRTLVIATILVTLLGGHVGAQQPATEAEAWRALAASLPPGSFVAIRLKDGRRFTGTIVQQRVDGVLFKPRTRLPVPAAELAFSDIDSLERRKPGISPGTKVVAGVAGTIGAIVLTGLIILASSYD